MAGQVRVLLFASAREAVGRPSLDRSIPVEGGPLGSFLTDLSRTYPRLGPVLRASRVAVNGEYVRGATRRVRPGDEVAIHPPYSGG